MTDSTKSTTDRNDASRAHTPNQTMQHEQAKASVAPEQKDKSAIGGGSTSRDSDTTSQTQAFERDSETSKATSTSR